MQEKEAVDNNTKPLKELLDQMMISANQYLDRALPEIKNLAESFYQSPSDETWKSLLQLLEGIQWLFKFMNSVVQGKDFYENWAKFEEISTKLQDQLYHLEEAVQSRDVTMIGDILLFEVVLILETAKGEILYTIDKEDIRHDLN